MTGSGRGIGAAIATRLASHGANVAINYAHSAGAAEAVAEHARSFGVKVITVKADVSLESEIAHMYQTVKAEFGRLDIVMSNSGIEHFGALLEVKGEEIDRVFAVNVKAQFFMAQQAYKHLEDGGRLILISSISAVMVSSLCEPRFPLHCSLPLQGIANHAVYSASKAAIQGMAKCLAWDFGKRGITVNCIAPGGVKTDMWVEAAAKYLPDSDKLTAEEIDARISLWSPMGRPGFPDDIAGVVALLASPEAQWLTGQTMHANGGAHMV